MCIALLLPLLLLFELVKLNFLPAAVEMLCGAREARGTEGRTDSSLQTGSPGAARGCSLQGQGVFTIHFNIAGDGAVIAGLPVPGCWGGVNEGLNRG